MKYCLLLLLVLSFACSLHADDSKPNVLFLAVDDMNDWIGCLEGTLPGEGPRAITSNLDKLAARGVNFTNAHTAGVFCAPSRAAIFSGQFASTTGCYQSANYFVNRPEIESLQTSFSKGGYTTLGTGKLFHHPVGAIDQRDWDRFFLRSKEQYENGWAIDSWSKGTPFPNPFPASFYNKGQEITGGLFLEWAGLPNGQEEEMADTMRVNWAVEQLGKPHDKPFFLACGIYAPHYPHYCPQKYFDLYDPDEIELPRYLAEDLSDLPPKIKNMKTNRLKIRKKLEDLDALKGAIHGYLACISYADAMMGRVLDALEKSPYAKNTIVVLWSDHGYHLGEKDWGKHSLWERTSNVPFIWAGPGVAQGVKSDATVSLIDMYPTFAEMCDLPKPHQPLEGESIADTLKNPAKAEDRDVFLPHMNAGEFAIINRDWRYIRYGDDGEELYNVQEDPHEWNNLAADPAHADLIAKMRKRAPETFAEPEAKFNSRKDLLIEGETYRWETGAGNYTPPPKYLPYTDQPAKPKANAGSAPAKQKPNIVFLFIDDWAWNGSSVAMDKSMPNSQMPVVEMPHMERLAREGMTFRNAYASPQCSPSRVCVQTGQSSPRNGFTVFLNPLGQDYYNEKKSKGFPVISCISDETIDPETTTIPEALKPLDYASAHIGKWHMRGDPGDEGYVKHDGDTDNKPGNTLVTGLAEGESKPKRLPADMKDPKLMFSVTERSIDFMQKQVKANRPFYLQISHYAMHAGSECLPATREKYAKHPLVQAWYEKNNKTADTVNIGDDPAVWLGMADDLDGRIGAVLEEISRLGIEDNTYVVLMSDNGYRHKQLHLDSALTQPMHGSKWWVWQGGIRVPMLVKGPGIKGGSVFEENVVNYDLLPTFVEWAGGTPNDLKDIDGVSLAGYMRGKNTSAVFRKRPLYFHYPHNRTSMPHSAIVSDNWKVLHFYERPNLPMIFNLDRDEAEAINVVERNPDKHKALFDEMMRYFKEVGARIPKVNPDYDPEFYKSIKDYDKLVKWGPFAGKRQLEEDERTVD